MTTFLTPIVLKMVCLLIVIYTFVINCIRVKYKNTIPCISVFVFSLALTGFIYLQWFAT